VVAHAAGCDKQDSLMRRRCAVSCTVDGRTAAVIDPIAKYWPRIAMFAYPTCIRRPCKGVQIGMLTLLGRTHEHLTGFASRLWRDD